MPTVTATELARNFRTMLDRVEFKHEELVVVRNNHEVARIPGPATMTALEAMADLYMGSCQSTYGPTAQKRK